MKVLILLTVPLAAWAALAEPPRVATDIPPVQALVARVMQGAGEPELILPPGASPHGYAMRPSEAAALANADLVVWMGEALTPWLGRAVASLSSDARSLELLKVNRTLLLGYREGMTFDEHEHVEGRMGEGHGNGHTEAHGNGHGEAHGDGDAEVHGDGHGDAHAEGGVDPHAWLDPENAKLWLDAIAVALAEMDPGNADLYAGNAAEGRAELDALIAELAQALGAVQDRPFIVFHDAYHYFEYRFGIEAAGAISLGDASSPGAARIAELRDTVRRTGARCIFAEPQFPSALIDTVVEGTEARAATLDPLGAGLEPGPELYPGIIRGLAEALRACLEPGA